MKIKKLLSFAAATAMAVTSLTSAMTFTASAADVSGTLTITAANKVTINSGSTATVELDGAKEYSATITLPSASAFTNEMGFFTLSPYPEGGPNFVINVNSITFSNSTTSNSCTFTDILDSQGLIPAETRSTASGKYDAALPRKGQYTEETVVAKDSNTSYCIKGTSSLKIYIDDETTFSYDTITYNFTVSKMATGDFTALDAAIEQGEKVDSSLYKADSYKAVTDAIAAAKAVKNNSESTQDDIDAAAKKITDAIDALVVKDIITVYTGSGSDMKSGTVEYTGKGDYSVTVIADTSNGYLTSNLGGFAFNPYPENGPDFQIDVNSIVITDKKIAGTDYTLTLTEGGTRIFPSADTVRDETNGLADTFVKDTVFAQSEDGNAVLIADYDGRATFKVYNTPAGLYSITYNFTVKDIEPEHTDL